MMDTSQHIVNDDETERRLDERALNESVAKWAGLDFVKHDMSGDGFVIRLTIKGKAFDNIFVDYFTHSLDACFKWLLPKLQADGWMARVQWSPLYDNETGKKLSDWTGYASVYDVSHKRGLTNFEFSAKGPTPALALCLAIKKLLQQEGK